MTVVFTLYDLEPPEMKTSVFTIVISLILFTVYSADSGPEIAGDILPEVKQEGQTAYLNCSVINLEAPAVVQWVMKTTSLHISTDENVKIDTVVDGKSKYDVVKTRNNTREQFQLIIRSLTETDSGNYTCQIYLVNQNYKDWPQKTGNLTVQKTMECQGQNCSSFSSNENGSPVSWLSFVTFLFGLFLSSIIKKMF